VEGRWEKRETEKVRIMDGGRGPEQVWRKSTSLHKSSQNNNGPRINAIGLRKCCYSRILYTVVVRKQSGGRPYTEGVYV